MGIQKSKEFFSLPLVNVMGAINIHCEIRPIEITLCTGLKKYYLLFAAFQIFAKMTLIRPRTPNFWPGQPSLALPMLVCWRQTMTHWYADTKASSFFNV